MRRSIKPLVIALVVVFAVSAAITGVLALTQIVPDIRSGQIGGANAQEYSEQWSLPLPADSSLSIDVSAVDVDLKPHDKQTLEASFLGTRIPDSSGRLPYIEVLVQADGITLRERHEQQAFLIIGGFSGGQIRGTLTIYVPREHMKDFKADTFSGNMAATGIWANSIAITTSSGGITASDLNSEGLLSFTTFSGNQTLNALRGMEAIFDASSGNINVTQLDALSLRVNTFSGKVELTGATIEEDAGITTSSGNIVLMQVSAGSLFTDQFSGKLDMEYVSAHRLGNFTTSSGNITGKSVTVPTLTFGSFSANVAIGDLKSDSITGETSSGDVGLSLYKGADIDISTFSGRVNLTLPKETEFSYDITTFSGGIDLGFGSVSKTSGDISGTIGGSEHSVAIDTSSGAVSIQPGN